MTSSCRSTTRPRPIVRGATGRAPSTKWPIVLGDMAVRLPTRCGHNTMRPHGCARRSQCIMKQRFDVAQVRYHLLLVIVGQQLARGRSSAVPPATARHRRRGRSSSVTWLRATRHDGHNTMWPYGCAGVHNARRSRCIMKQRFNVARVRYHLLIVIVGQQLARGRSSAVSPAARHRRRGRSSPGHRLRAIRHNATLTYSPIYAVETY